MLRFSLVVMLLANSLPVLASENWVDVYFPHSDYGLDVRVDSISWTETLPNGKTLLTETGMRGGVGVFVNNATRALPGLVYDLSASVHLGLTNYDGHTFDDQGNFYKAQTQSDYIWFNANGLAGFRQGYISGNTMLDYLGGVELDIWQRHLHALVDSAGNRADDYTEEYHIVSAKLGLGFHNNASEHKGWTRLGIKYPVFTKETIESFNLTLTPGKQYSFFFSIEGSNFITAGDRISLYYEGLRFSQSNVVANLAQPQSEMHVVGVTIEF